MNDLDFWRKAFVLTAATGQTLFLVLYVFFPWWKSFLGKALFYKAIVFAALLNIATVGFVFDWTFEDATIVVLYGLVATGIWAQNIAFLKVRAEGRQNHLGEEHE